MYRIDEIRVFTSEVTSSFRDIVLSKKLRVNWDSDEKCQITIVDIDTGVKHYINQKELLRLAMDRQVCFTTFGSNCVICTLSTEKASLLDDKVTFDSLVLEDDIKDCPAFLNWYKHGHLDIVGSWGTDSVATKNLNHVYLVNQFNNAGRKHGVIYVTPLVGVTKAADICDRADIQFSNVIDYFFCNKEKFFIHENKLFASMTMRNDLQILFAAFRFDPRLLVEFL